MPARVIIGFCPLVLMVLVAVTPCGHAFQTWPSCEGCHGGFLDSPYTSLSDGQSWGDDLHDGHRTFMLSGDCNTCHSAGGFTPVLLNSSTGGNGLAAIACVGCHGRAEDRPDPGVAIGDGAGLRQHHWNAGINSCLTCHSDSNPANYMPVGEDVAPPYYFTPDINHPDKATDSCNLAGEEDYFGSAVGLDNDGDLDYDGADADCVAAPACGDANDSGEVNATDALVTLQTAVGSQSCELCVCDVDQADGIKATDALTILQFGVGQAVQLNCSAC